jgi:hypothetical protein
MSPAIRQEWSEHQSNFTSTWFTDMKSRRRVEFVADGFDSLLRESVSADAAGQDERRRVLNDIHLVEAARLADRTVASGDEAVRRDLRHLAGSIEKIRLIYWVNPTIQAERCIHWLASDAPDEPARRLG